MKITRAANGQLIYRYFGDVGAPMVATTLAAIDEPYQSAARAALTHRRFRGYTIEYGRELDASPWVADFAVKEKPC